MRFSKASKRDDNCTSFGGQSYTYTSLGDRVQVDKLTGARHFVYDAWGRVVAEYGASALDVKAEFIWAIPPAANGSADTIHLQHNPQ
ncbi:hypothetical protein ACI5KX_14040 [Erythrobacter sp. GH1-10]|uniref:hypothetical protein n=1 Tax=Erythrobacter sp. GH1-10 TaxID=3349334 RepID=UPI003877B3F0